MGRRKKVKKIYPTVEILNHLDLSKHFDLMRSQGLSQVADILEPLSRDQILHPHSGDFFRWEEVVSELPLAEPSAVFLDRSAVTLTAPKDIPILEKQLQELRPWRKGPYHIMGVDIDTEWRSDWKWDRLKLPSLKGKRILDLGCGNGYHCLRMLGAGASLVTGIDPSWFSFFQFQAVQHFLQEPRVAVLPLKDTHLEGISKAFDMVFSMGVLYHQKSPVDHLRQLGSLLAPEGAVVVETLIIEESSATALYPEGRYGKMRNVSAIPSPSLMEEWLQEAGFSRIELLDISRTTTQEQRSTDWMRFESLKDYLDPEDSTKTIEGYPAPVRGAWIAYL